ncbi:DciA family protein [Methylocaldum sp.]|uniref:DciA family protein n=1 Tax=Methylocaldum sp. TaxID=1969727 RepID=UPI002D266916|nr:DciA family protein [Methylocaldum sp.]HYE35835.1 DciA family protein [Methylocaldum sp.]
MARQPESVAGLLRGSAIQAISAQIERHRRVLSAARKALPGFLADHCVDCVIKPDQLILYVDSPAWASQIRFYALHLLPRIEQSTGHRFRNLQIRNVLPAVIEPLDKPLFVTPPGFVAELLKSSASSTSSGELKEALLRLSQTVQALRNTGPSEEGQ